MIPKISAEDFGVLVRLSGMTMSAAQQAELHVSYGYIEEMIARIGFDRPREAEPALIFVAGDVS